MFQMKACVLTPQNFHYGLEAENYRQDLERDGSYILRTNAIGSDAIRAKTPDGVETAGTETNACTQAGRVMANARRCSDCERTGLIVLVKQIQLQ